MTGQSSSNGSSGARGDGVALSGSKKTAAADNKNGGDGNINNNDDDMESTGSKLLVEQILQEAQKSSERGGGGFPLWKGRKMKNKGVYVPKKKKGGRSSPSSSSQQRGESRQEGQQVDNNKQRGKNRVRFSFNFDADDDDAEAESGHYDGSMAAPTKRSDKRAAAATNVVSSSSVCQVVLMLVVAIILGIVLFAFAPLNISSIFIRGQGKEDDGTVVFDSEYSSTELGQEMLELAEQINIACGESILLQNSISGKAGGGGGSGSGMMSTCQSLCHNNMCCFEKDEEYSCKDDVTKDCGVYAGCVVLIDDNFW